MATIFDFQNGDYFFLKSGNISASNHPRHMILVSTHTFSRLRNPEQLQIRVRAAIVDQAAITMSQNVVFGFKSKRQVTYKPSDEGAGFRSQQARENPQAVGLALTTVRENVCNNSKKRKKSCFFGF